MSSTFIKSNIFSPLCFDTLPYETPILFNNFSFYKRLREIYKDSLKKNKEQKFAHLFKSIENDSNIEKIFVEKFFDFFEIPNNIKKSKEFIPYNYKILKNIDSYRVLSVIHPISQIQICFFYENNVDRVLFYTNRSNFSLRYPSSKAKKVFFHHEGTLRLFDSDSEFSSSYIRDSFSAKFFSYKKYEFIFSFFDSDYFLQIEKKYKFFFRFDITRCFENIYTHSISWAIKGISYSKKHKGSKDESFESKLDAIMRNSNWGETHGIPIGSEFSRVFAEIILQRIDLDIERRLKDGRFKLISKKDYILHRYVDDYFLFTNEKKIEEEILEVCKDCLQNYKLFLNEKKFTELQRPFVTDLSVAKSKIHNLIKNFCSNFDKKLELLICKICDSKAPPFFSCNYAIDEFSRESYEIFSSKNLIRRIRNITCEQRIDFHVLSNLILSVFKTNLIKTYEIVKKTKDITEEIITCLYDYIRAVLEVTFYIFSVSSKANTTYGLCKISFICLEFYSLLKKTIKDNLELISLSEHKNKEIAQFIYTELSLFMERFNSCVTPPVEILDIFWILKVIRNIDPLFLLSKSKFISFFGLKYTNKNLDCIDASNYSSAIVSITRELSYFEIISIIFYLGENGDALVKLNDKQNDSSVLWIEILEVIVEHVKTKFQNEEFMKETENFLLFYDLISCPYLSKKQKSSILNESSFFKDQKINNRNKSIERFISKFESDDVFFGWRLPFSISTLFWFKDLHQAY